MHRNFLKTFILSYVFIGFFVSGFLLFLIKVGESNLESVINRQMISNNNILFNSGIHGDFFDYKLKLYELVVPTVIAIGSSRAMPVRGEFFSAPFSNYGGAAGSVARIKEVVNRISPPPPKLKIALVFIDFWWFFPNSQYSPQNEEYTPPIYPLFPDAATIYGAGRVIVQNFRRISSLIPPPSDRLGLHGIISNEGFDKYGSYHYTSTIVGEKISTDEKFELTKNRIEKGVMGFEYSDTADRTLVRQFIKTVNQLKQQNIHVILIFPPLPAYVNKLMDESRKYGYISDLKALLAADGITYYDYTNATKIQDIKQPDCEFIDGLHGGDVVYARLISDIAKNDFMLRHYLNNEYLSEFINRYSGFAEGVNKFRRGKNEIDFLRLGCEK